MIGTTRRPHSGSRTRLRISLASAIVVETAWSGRVPWTNSANALSGGLGSGFARTTRFGTQPPSWRRRSSR